MQSLLSFVSFLAHKTVFERDTKLKVFRMQAHFHLTQINIMTFSKGRQSPNKCKSNYCLESP